MSTTSQERNDPDSVANADPTEDRAAPPAPESTASERQIRAKRVSLREPEKLQANAQLRIYSHSSLLYWWPVWAVGYVMALLTFWHGKPQQVEALGQARNWFHPSNNLGVLFFLVIFVVILITNFSVRGLASGMVIMGGVLLAVVLAYLGWWDEVFSWFGNLKIHVSMGGYFWFSTMMFLTWAITVFGLDRLSYWQVTPGQLTHKIHFGTGSKSFNSQGMSLEKHRDDLFRHWLLGLGSGDLTIRTSGATHELIEVSNVLFIGSKVEMMKRLIAEVPEGPEVS